MMNIEHAKKAFQKYLEQYDCRDDKIRLKIVHTYGVVRCMNQITQKMGLSQKDRELAELIALLHDIGRFEQLKRFGSFEPGVMDHAAYGVEVLFDRGMIREFIDDERYDEIIRTAIARHSDYKLEGITDPGILLHARLIRDADKLDNCRVKLEDGIETMLDMSAEEVGRQEITPEVLEQIYQKKPVDNRIRKTKMDYWVSYVAYFFDINFCETLEIIDQEDYVDRIVRRIPYANADTAEKMEKIAGFLRADIKQRIALYRKK